MKTALQQLIEYLDPIHSGIKQKAEELLKVEEKQIIDAFLEGDLDRYRKEMKYPKGQDYYNQTYTK